jgi:hypothetical protein
MTKHQTAAEAYEANQRDIMMLMDLLKAELGPVQCSTRPWGATPRPARRNPGGEHTLTTVSLVAIALAVTQRLSWGPWKAVRLASSRYT